MTASRHAGPGPLLAAIGGVDVTQRPVTGIAVLSLAAAAHAAWVLRPPAGQPAHALQLPPTP